MIMVVVGVVMMAFIRIDCLLSLSSSTKLANLAQRVQYLRLTIAGAPDISRHLSNLCTRWICLSLGWALSKKVFCWYCAHLFWEAIVEQLSKRVGHHFAEIQVWVCRTNFVPKQLISNQIFERPNIFIQFCSLKRNYIFPISRHWDVTVSLALSLICWGRDGTLLSITLKSKWPPLPSSCFVFSFGFWLWTGDLGGKGGKSREAQIKCRLIWSRHRLKPFLASKLLSP